MLSRDEIGNGKAVSIVSARNNDCTFDSIYRINIGARGSVSYIYTNPNNYIIPQFIYMYMCKDSRLGKLLLM